MISRPLPLLLAAGLVLVAGGVSLASMGTSTLPTLKESQVLVRWDAAPGTSLTEMDRLTARAARELRSLPGVTQIGGHVGRAVTADQIVGVNSGELWVTIGPDADYGKTLSSIRNVMSGYPGLGSHVEAFSTEKVRENLTGTAGNSHRRPGLRRGIADPRAQRHQARVGDRPGRRRHARTCHTAGRGADDQGPGQSRRGGQVRAEARRRPARRRDAPLRNARGQPLREGARVRRRGLGHAADEEQSHERPQPPDRDTLRERTCISVRSPTCASRRRRP